MQNINCYYYSNDVDVQLNMDPTLSLRNRVVYMKSVKLYKGIDNVVRFTFKNGNQQRVNITGFAVSFHLISEYEGSVILSKDATVVDAENGIVTVTLTELDLLDLNDRHYEYSLLVTDVDTGEQHVVYSDTGYSVRGEIILQSGHYPTFRESINVDLPNTHLGFTLSGMVQADTPSRQLSSHHTAQFYFDDFTGVIEIQATLDSLPTSGPISWAIVEILAFDNQSVPAYWNWDGVFTAVRFLITPDAGTTGKVTKILYRS